MLFWKKAEKKKQKPVEEAYVEGLKVSTMPEKFLRATLPRSSGALKKILWVVFAILFVVGVSVWAYFYFVPQDQSQKLIKTKNIPAKNTQLLVKDNPNTKRSPNIVNTNTSNTNTVSANSENTNANTNTNTNANTNVNTNSSVDSSEVNVAASDRDGDMVSDQEEFLYGTQLRLRDSDNDTYLDGEEVLNLYDPARVGKTLQESPVMAVFRDTGARYRLLYPKQWVVQRDDGKDTVEWTSVDKDKVRLRLFELAGSSFSEWFAKTYPSEDVKQLHMEAIPNGTSYETLDGLSYWVVHDGNVFHFEYTPSTTHTLSYITTIRMMLRSLQADETQI